MSVTPESPSTFPDLPTALEGDPALRRIHDVLRVLWLHAEGISLSWEDGLPVFVYPDPVREVVPDPAMLDRIVCLLSHRAPSLWTSLPECLGLPMEETVNLIDTVFLFRDVARRMGGRLERRRIVLHHEAMRTLYPRWGLLLEEEKACTPRGGPLPEDADHPAGPAVLFEPPAMLEWTLGTGHDERQARPSLDAIRHRLALAREFAAVLPLLACLGDAADSGVRARHLPRLLGVPRALLSDIRGRGSLPDTIRQDFETRAQVRMRADAIRIMKRTRLPHHLWPTTLAGLDAVLPWWSPFVRHVGLRPDVVRAIHLLMLPKDTAIRDWDTADSFRGNPIRHILRDSMEIVERWIVQPLCEPADHARPGLRERTSLLKSLVVEAIVEGRSPRRIMHLLLDLHERAGDFAEAALDDEATPGAWPALTEGSLHEAHGIRLEPVTTARGLYEEGQAMRHCVGGYVHACANLRSFVYGVRRASDGARLATLELVSANGTTDAGGIRLGQLRGPCNGDVSPEVVQACEAFVEGIRTGHVAVLDGAEAAAHHDRLSALEEKQEADRNEIRRRRSEEVFPLFWDLLPGSRGTTMAEWAASIGWRGDAPGRSADPSREEVAA